MVVNCHEFDLLNTALIALWLQWRFNAFFYYQKRTKTSNEFKIMINPINHIFFKKKNYFIPNCANFCRSLILNHRVLSYANPQHRALWLIAKLLSIPCDLIRNSICIL